MSSSSLSAPLRSFTLLQAQRSAGTLTVLAAFLGCAVSGEMGAPLCGLFAAALLGAQLLGSRFAHKHAAIWTVILFGALLVIGLQVFTGVLDIVLGAARFALLLCAHRLWNRATERDELLLLLLSLLLLCAGAALSAELLFGFAFAMFAVTGTWALALTHLRFRIEEGRGESGLAMLNSRRLITAPMLGALGGLSLIALLGAGALFVVFPRVTLGSLHRMAHTHAIAGLSDSVELGGHGTIADDPRVAMRVRLPPEEETGASELAMHWRARALEVWTGRGWRARPGLVKPELPKPPPRQHLKKHLKNRLHTYELEILSSFSEGVLLAPEGVPVSVQFPQPLSARMAFKQALANPAGDLLYQPIETGDLRYTLSALTLDRAEVPPQPEALALPAEVKLDTVAPESLDLRVRALGEKLAKGKAPREAAQAVEDYLSRGFSYTRVLEEGGEDPIADFLFRRHAGHCELFSSAMVLLLRAGGIPARNVTGYYGGVRMAGGYYAVRAGDAHSWVEVWEPGLGWMLWDPTPAGDRGSHQDGLWARAVLLWDGLESRWLTNVVAFDLLSQARAVSELGRVFSEVSQRLAGRGTGTSGKISVRQLAITLGELLGIIILVASWRRWRARSSGEPILSADQLRARSLWRKARARLGKAGAELNESLPPREAARCAEEQLGRSLAPLETLVDRVAAARWGGRPLPAQESRLLLAELNRALRAAG